MSEQSSVQHVLTKSQLCYFSRQFSNMFGLPVRLYRQQEKIYTYSPVQLAADPVTLCIDALLQETAPLVLLWLCPASVVLLCRRTSQRTGNFGTRIEKAGRFAAFAA